MPSSPYREKSRRYQRKPSRSPQEDRNYGGQSRKKVNRDRDYDNSYQSRREHQQTKYDSRRDKAYIKTDKIETIQVKFTQPPSELKVHFRFKPLKVNQKNQQELMHRVKQHFSSNIGPVEYFNRSYDSRPGYLVIELGFKYDQDALVYYMGKINKIEVKLNGTQLDMIPEPTHAFKLMIPELQSKKKKDKERNDRTEKTSLRKRSLQKDKQRSKQRSKDKQRVKHRRRSSSSSKSRSSSSSSRSKSRRQKQDKRSKTYKQKDNDRYNYGKQSRYDYHNIDRRQRQRQPKQPNRHYEKDDRKQYQRKHHSYQHNLSNDKYNNDNKDNRENKDGKQQQNQGNLKTLFFFGIHYSVNSKDMTQLLYHHNQGPFYSKKFIWRRINNSICEFLEARFQISQANKLLQIGDKMQVKGHPFIIIQGQSTANEYIMQKLSQYQVNIQFPKFVQPYHLLKSLIQCGRLIQIISNNKLNQQGRSDFYNVTFNCKEICQKLIQVKKTVKGIVVQGISQEDVMLVFRPNSQTQLMSSNHPVQEQDDKRSEFSRSFSQRSN